MISFSFGLMDSRNLVYDLLVEDPIPSKSTQNVIRDIPWNYWNFTVSSVFSSPVQLINILQLELAFLYGWIQYFRVFFFVFEILDPIILPHPHQTIWCIQMCELRNFVSDIWGQVLKRHVADIFLLEYMKHLKKHSNVLT